MSDEKLNELRENAKNSYDNIYDMIVDTHATALVQSIEYMDMSKAEIFAAIMGGK